MTRLGGSNCDTDFSLVAPFYSGRVPYASEFFRAAACAIDLRTDSFIVDLACGTGELANGFAPYCRSVLALDKSTAMMSARSCERANVTFRQLDLNSGPLAVSEPADLVVMGRSIHLFEKERLLPHLESSTKEGGTVLICSAGMAATNAWIGSYNTLLERYGLRRTAARRAAGLHVFAETHWHQSNGVVSYYRMRWGLPEFTRHSLAYSSVSQAIAAAGAAFRAELESILAPYWDQSRQIDVEQVSWGIPYRRQRIMPAADRR